MPTPVQPGDPLRIPADKWNALMDLLQRTPTRGEPTPTRTDVWARNETTHTVLPGYVYRWRTANLTVHAITSNDMPPVPRRAVLSIDDVTEDFCDRLSPQIITPTRPIQPGEIGPCRISGAAVFAATDPPLYPTGDVDINLKYDYGRVVFWPDGIYTKGRITSGRFGQLRLMAMHRDVDTYDRPWAIFAWPATPPPILCRIDADLMLGHTDQPTVAATIPSGTTTNPETLTVYNRRILYWPTSDPEAVDTFRSGTYGWAIWHNNTVTDGATGYYWQPERRIDTIWGQLTEDLSTGGSARMNNYDYGDNHRLEYIRVHAPPLLGYTTIPAYRYVAAGFAGDRWRLLSVQDDPTS